MLSQLTLDKRSNLPVELDYQQLYAIGLKHVQRLSSRIWTDYNVHDPGITTLELLSYALTDLSYRASFPIADLLASETNNRENMQQQFFTARQILPNRALTQLDYRKLLIDLPGVKNAWVQPAPQAYYIDPVKGELLGTPTLLDEELINLPLFAARLKQKSPDSVSLYLLTQLQDGTRRKLSIYDGEDPEAESLRTRLVQDLNRVIQGDVFYKAEWLSGLTLSSETQFLVEQYQQATNKKQSLENISDRLNRLFLEDVYPEAIAHYHLLIQRISDLPSFTATLKQSSPNPVSRYLVEQLRDVTRQALAAYEEEYSETQTLHTLLVQDLNRIVQGDSIYEEQRFRDVTLSRATLGLIALQQQVDADSPSRTKIRDRLNRLLLNDSYPLGIACHQPLRTTATLQSIKKINLAGLYEVIIDYMDHITTLDQKETVMREVKQRLHANRNLCEDFVSIRDIETDSFLLCAELELAPDADVSQVKSEILFQVQHYLAPPVNNYTLSEMLTRKKADGTTYTADEIFEGPTLDCGFIDDAELDQAELRQMIRLSDVISIIMDIPGVLAVRDIVINPQDPSDPLVNKWSVPIAPGKKALLDRERSRLVFYKRNMPVVANETSVSQHYTNLTDAVKAKAETPFAYDLDIPLGTYRQSDRYYSMQNHFPGIYGLAYQLKAYLLFFDQLMANYFAQLGQVSQLFSTDANLHRTYFFQVVDSFAEYEKIYKNPDDIAIHLQNQNDEQEREHNLQRRHHFLDHLIARFAERFHEFAAIMHATFGASAESMVGYKCKFLQHYPTISRERAIAYNYSLKRNDDLWNSTNISGLEERLAKLLGIRNSSRRNLGDIAHDIYAEIDETPIDEFRFRIRNRNTLDILLSSSTHYSSPALARQALERAIQFASLPSGYQRKIAANGKHYFNIVGDTGGILARRIEYFDSELQMNQAIDEVIEYMRVNYSDEGMYLIENILLCPEHPDDPFLPICPDPNCIDCADLDPYSYRLHIILPAYGSHFSTMEFRRFAEEVIRSETPAHILPKVCWISKDDMAVLEKCYRDWIYLKAGVETAQCSEKLQALIDILFSAKNIYPTQKLYECDSGDDQPKFILGQTSLGTGEEINA
jgi:hypothetical protein